MKSRSKIKSIRIDEVLIDKIEYIGDGNFTKGIELIISEYFNHNSILNMSKLEYQNYLNKISKLKKVINDIKIETIM